MTNLIFRPTWNECEKRATPEHIALNRRGFLRRAYQSLLGAGFVATAGSDLNVKSASARMSVEQNTRYGQPAAITDENVAITYNNFYEFGSHKKISVAAQRLAVKPWRLVVDGEVENPIDMDAHDLINQMQLEERVYRLRCVEAWSMVIPWIGFPFRKLLDKAGPLSSGKYVRMETFMNKDVASGQRQHWYPWPYVEALTIQEAAHDLAFLVTGAYGKELPKQMGAPIRLAAPWKYGFKSIKSIVKITIVRERPVSFWEQLAPKEYGFWANVNPAIAHPRWSQAYERDVATGARRPTEKWNGYGEWVASLYPEDGGERLFR